jgi:Pregnancy-associated plasma protein-A
MNLNYGLTFFHFNLLGIDYTVNNTWADGGVPDSEDPLSVQVDLEMKRKLRRGNYAALNLYFQSRYEAGTTWYGYCTFPEADIVTNSTQFYQDGCSVDQKTLPGLSTNTTFNFGYTAVHETGHWLGVFHPFQENTCDFDGDQVPDTPFQSTMTLGCPPRKDSCLLALGDDSIHNIMDYSDDCCVDGFTADQARRMLGVWFLRGTQDL